MPSKDSDPSDLLNTGYAANLELSHESVASHRESPQSRSNWMAILWARKYVSFVNNRKMSMQSQRTESAEMLASKAGRHQTATLLRQQLSFASAQAWSKTELLLASEIHAHGIDMRLIKPLEIAEDLMQIFKQVLCAYADDIKPERLSVLIGAEIGKVRHKYTETDPRVLGCVSMQFHYTGQLLLDRLSNVEKALFGQYIKVMDDHMYMPLRKLYTAAATHSLESSALKAVQHLLANSTPIAHHVREKVCRVNPTYETYSGLLRSNTVKDSSIRDVEMFQVYLCLCALENRIQPVQIELFPLCVMLYPPLKVEWILVQEMLQALTWEMADRLSTEDMTVFMPYLRLVGDMFSLEVFRVFLSDAHHPG